jgi:AAHS family 4-hydroxybenzoate transporter-like MFS transporter
LTYARAGMLFVCFLVVLLDGLDAGAVAIVTPMLAKQWGVTPAMFTSVFVATNVGAVVGYTTCGPLSARFGQRLIGISSVVLFGAGTLLSALAVDVTSLSVVRFASAIGLGGALPIAVTAATNVVSETIRTSAAVLVTMGLSAGGVVGGTIGGPLMARFGWPSIFIVGGLLPLFLLPLFAWVLSAPEQKSVQANVDNARSRATPGALFANGLGLTTCLLWFFAFLMFLVSYALASWIPTLLVDFGFSPIQAPLGAAAYGVGGLVGGILVLSVMGRFGIRPVLMITSLVAIMSIGTMSHVTASSSLLLPLIGAIGAGVITGCVGQSALAVSFYPVSLRTTGVGWAAACGRIGSVVGPAVGGALLSLQWSARDIILTAIPLIAIAIIVLATMSLAERRQALART